MRLAVDTSFLFSLYGKDCWTETARAMSFKFDTAIRLTVFNTLELTNASLHAEFAGHLDTGFGNLIVSRFEDEKRSGRLIYPPCNLSNIVARATELSRRYALTEGHRTYDILLVAAALELKATDFLTFDSRQAKLAEAEGLQVNEAG